MGRLIRDVFLLDILSILALLICVRPAGAQTLADSAQLITLAVQGFRSPNGPVIEFSRRIPCGGFVERCRTSQAPTNHSPSLVLALAKELSLPPAADSGPVSCPWGGGWGVRRGVVLELGQLRVKGDTASVYVELRCRGGRGAFFEGGVVSLGRKDGVWKVTGVSSHVIT
jgi:hypothetical protein